MMKYLILLLSQLISHGLSKDLGIRYNKVAIDPRFNSSDIKLPLTSDDFPIQIETFRWLRFMIASTVVIPQTCFNCPWDFEELIGTIGGMPPYPSTDENDLFWEELAHVSKIQKLRREGVDPSLVMPLPDIWKEKTIGDIAEAVHDQFLGIHHIEQITKWSKAGMIKIDFNIVPLVSIVDFVRVNCMIADTLTWAIAQVGKINFGLKWHVGYPRPEEVAFMIATDKITQGPPATLVNEIKSFNISFATNFTAYPEGSPRHPSWPAMHSAASAVSLWLPAVLKLTPEQLCQVKLLDYAISYARTVAGVHYKTDNLAGLKLGQEIIARLLPKYLNETYGSSITRVTAKVESLRFDWGTFLESDCAKAAM
jgi:membrane-associated phospholipid phosphatase